MIWVMYPRQYVQFLYSFNKLADYYECHDLLEDLWLEEGRDPFYQGLLQVAVSCYHTQNANLSGARKLMQAALQKLTLYPAEWMGIQLDRVVQDAQFYLHQLMLDEAGNPVLFLIPIVDPNLIILVEQIQLDKGDTLS
jgi:uncharacterized protein